LNAYDDIVMDQAATSAEAPNAYTLASCAFNSEEPDFDRAIEDSMQVDQLDLTVNSTELGLWKGIGVNWVIATEEGWRNMQACRYNTEEAAGRSAS
jgi:hypothetical protein